MFPETFLDSYIEALLKKKKFTETAVIWINSTRLDLKFIRLLVGVFAQFSKHLICISADGNGVSYCRRLRVTVNMACSGNAGVKVNLSKRACKS